MPFSLQIPKFANSYTSQLYVYVIDALLTADIYTFLNLGRNCTFDVCALQKVAIHTSITT